MQTQNITLDFCRNDYRAITIKQYDAGSRHILITCTNNGSVYKLDSSIHTCNVKMMTPDNRAIWDNRCVSITEDGKVHVTFTENMVMANGTGKLEIQIIENSTSYELSTMILTVIIIGSVYSNDEIIASDEFNVLKDTLDKATIDYTYVMENAQSSANAAKNSAASASSLAKAASESANRARECVESIDPEVINAKLSAKGDSLYYDDETHLLYLMSEGQIIGEGIQVATGTGSGSGGGSGVSDIIMKLTNTSGFSSKIILKGESVDLSFTFTSTDDGVSTGSGTCQIIVNSITKSTFEIDQGLNTITLTSDMLSAGANAVVIKCTDVYGKYKLLRYNIDMMDIYLTSTFDDTITYNDTIQFKYIPYGTLTKTIYVLVDGNEVYTTTTTETGKQTTVNIEGLSHGVHRLDTYMIATVNDEEIESEHLVYDIMYVVEGNTNKLISSVYNIDAISQGEQVSIPYIVYDPTSLSSDVSLIISVNGNQYSSQNVTVDRSRQYWNTREYPVGDVSFTIKCGDIVKTHNITVAASDINVYPVTNDLELYLTASGRSNNELNPAVWEYNGIKTTFTNVNWDSTGWAMDDKGDSVLRLHGGATAEIEFQPFLNDWKAYGKTIEMEFAIRDVNNREAVVVSCIDNGIGIEVTADTAKMTSEQSEISCHYCDEKRIRVSFVVESRNEYRLLLIYLNGVLSGAKQYPATDNFQQTTPMNIVIGSPYCGIDVYTIRSYTNALTFQEVVRNFNADLTDIAEKMKVYEANNIYDEYGNLKYEKVKPKIPVMTIIGALPQSKGDKKDVKIKFEHNTDSNLSYEDTAVLDVQGTSSQWSKSKGYRSE